MAAAATADGLPGRLALLRDRGEGRSYLVDTGSAYSRAGHPFFSKERNVLEFFSVLYKRTQHSLRSFPFFIKEHGVLCVLFFSL